MKKILMGSLFLTVIGAAITSTQVSCNKTTGQASGYVLPSATSSKLGGVIIGSGLSVTTSGVVSVNSTANNGLTQLNLILFTKMYRYGGGTLYSTEVWTASIDGSNQKKIPITVPSGLTMGDVRLTPDGKTVIYSLSDAVNRLSKIYSCSIDGSNVKKIVDITAMDTYADIQGVY